MEAIKVSLYEKNKETGMFEDLLGAYVIEDHVALLDKAYAINEDGRKVHLYLTVAGEVEDAEYEAIYDQYDGEGFSDMDVTIEEVEDSYNPTWLFIFDFMTDLDDMNEKINHILEIHNSELERILKNIKTK